MHNEELFNRALGAYLGFACGDALGATVEFMTPKQIQKRYGSHQDIIGGGWLHLNPGQVTDDTQMSMALAQAIIDHQHWNIQAIADNFADWLRSDPPDVGNTCRRGIHRYLETGKLFGEQRDDEAGNGACMRNLPVVLATLNHPEDLQDYSQQQSHLTHHHPLSDAATLTLGRMLAALIKHQDLSACQHEAELLCQQHAEFCYTPYPGKASAYIVDTLQTVFHYFFSTDSFESCVIATVNQGADADTTGALVGMLAGAYYGIEAIPQRWLTKLDPQVSLKITQQTQALLRLSEKGLRKDE